MALRPSYPMVTEERSCLFFFLLIMFCHTVALLKPTQDVRGEHKLAKQHMFGVGPISDIAPPAFLTNEAFALAPKHFSV